MLIAANVARRLSSEREISPHRVILLRFLENRLTDEPTDLRISVHQEIPADPAFNLAWNALVERMESPEVFYTFEWISAVNRAYRNALPPWFFLAWQDQDLVGAVALTVDTERRIARFLAGTTSDYCDFLSHCDLREELVGRVLEGLQQAGVETMVFANVPADSPTSNAIQKASRRHGLHVFVRPAYQCARVELGPMEERQQAKLILDRKKMFRRKLHALERIGQVRLDQLRTFDQIKSVLNQFYEVHVGRFLTEGRVSNLVSAERREFVGELTRLVGERGWLKLSQLTVGGQPIAWNYGFQFKGSWFWYQPAFHPAYDDYSPGYFLLSKMIMEACDDPEIRIVDLGLGAEGYKERFANATRPTIDITVTRSAAQSWQVRLRYHAASAIKRSPLVESTLRRVLERGRSLKRRKRDLGSTGFFRWIAHRVSRLVASTDRVEFYQWVEAADRKGRKLSSGQLRALDLGALSRAAMLYERDEETSAYLIRSARRLQAQEAETRGFVLVAEDTPVHFCWVMPFNDYYMDELKIHLVSTSDSAMMIFDCWTPRDARGHGYYATAIGLLSEELSAAGKEPWIFSASTNKSSLCGIEKAGFGNKYAMVQRRIMGWRSI